MFHCPVGVWVIEQHAIILSTTVRSPTVIYIHKAQLTSYDLVTPYGVSDCGHHRFW